MFILMVKKYATLLLALWGGHRADGLFPSLRPQQDTVPDDGHRPVGRRLYDGRLDHPRGRKQRSHGEHRRPGTPGPAARQSSMQVQDASSVFDFHITPEWIVAHWPTVSTGLAQLQLEGYRVPLVTGTAQHDLAGSLTYYFDAEQKLQQITFIGTTGDPRPLIGLLTTRFHLTRRLVNDPGLVVYEAVHYNNQPASSLRIRLAPLAQPNDLYRCYDIELSLGRPVVGESRKGLEGFRRMS